MRSSTMAGTCVSSTSGGAPVFTAPDRPVRKPPDVQAGPGQYVMTLPVACHHHAKKSQARTERRFVAQVRVHVLYEVIIVLVMFRAGWRVTVLQCCQ